jgi:hypothetical protein
MPRGFIARIFEAAARLPSQRMHESIVVTGLIVFNFLLLALAAAAGLFDADIVFVLALLLLAATAALMSIDRQ